jgi:hypothetical protein
LCTCNIYALNKALFHFISFHFISIIKVYSIIKVNKKIKPKYIIGNQTVLAQNLKRSFNKS